MDFRKKVTSGIFAVVLLASGVLAVGCTTWDNPWVGGYYDEETGSSLRVSDVEALKGSGDTSGHSGGNSLLAGCSRNAIVGKFQETDGSEILEFFNDGTCTVTNSGTSLSGTYSYEDSFGGYSIKIEGPFGIVGSYEGYLDNNTLTLVNGNKEDVYERL